MAGAKYRAASSGIVPSAPRGRADLGQDGSSQDRFGASPAGAPARAQPWNLGTAKRLVPVQRGTRMHRAPVTGSILWLVLVAASGSAGAETSGWVDPPTERPSVVQREIAPPASPAPSNVRAPAPSPAQTSALAPPAPPAAEPKAEPARPARVVQRAAPPIRAASRPRAARKSAGVFTRVFGPPRRNAHVITTTQSR